jgi:signal transduction histidine kinase
MAIGQSLDYEKNCNLLLTLILKRKNLNAAWILVKENNKLKSTFALPNGKAVEVDSTSYDILDTIEDFKLIDNNSIVSKISPIDVSQGSIVIFSLKAEGYLFLYSKKESIDLESLRQLNPVMNKFTMSLKACKAFKKQKKLLNELAYQNQELSDYAHMVSHDLKSPLRSIDTLTAWLKEDYKDAFDANGKKTLSQIRNNVEKMDILIKGILDYSTIGKNRIEVYDVNTNKLIDNILDIIQIPKHITITKYDLPIIKGDKYRLQQLFQNLIGNAISYNDKTNGIVEIGAGSKGDMWEFYVRDNGKGIEPVYFDKIFNTFQKLENNIESTGIGLSIVKKIVTLYGGKIWLTSTLNKGTTFYFTLKKDANGKA